MKLIDIFQKLLTLQYVGDGMNRKLGTPSQDTKGGVGGGLGVVGGVTEQLTLSESSQV